jgi:SecD/SecF fusion protein
MNLLAQSPQNADAALYGGNPFFNFIFNCFSDPLFIFIAGMALLGLFFWYLSSDDDKMKRNSGTLFIIGISAFSLFSLMTSGIRYGIDIDGGVSFTLQVQPNIIDGKPEPLSSQAMEQACLTINERLNASGANEVTVMPQGQDKIQIQIPETDPEKIKKQREIITKIAHLEILPVHPNNHRLISEGIERVPGYQLYDYEFTSESGKVFHEKFFLTKLPLLTGKDIKSAHPNYAQKGYIGVTLSNDGAEKLWNATLKMKKGVDRLAIVLDGRVISAPVVQANLSKDFSISGLDKPGEAEQLAKTLTNPLSNELKILEQRQVSASLGKAALVQSEWAGVAGLLICFLLVAIYYRFAGIVAMVGLTINALILLGLMSLFGFVLTLPGIAGIVLTLGMAVDANVLINERLREEKEKGNSFGYALRKSYEKAFSAIFDSNITSLITAVILFFMASGTIKGFAVTLIIGILSSMIGAIVVTRVLFYWMEKTGLLHNMQFLNVFKRMKKFDFLSKRKIFMTISVTCIVASFVAAVVQKDKCLGIDFTGGTSITYDIPDGVKTDFKDVEKIIAKLTLSQTTTVQEFTTPTGDSIIIRCAANQDDIAKITQAVQKEVPQIVKTSGPSVDMVGPILGEEFLNSSMWAIIAGLIGIMLYMAVRFEWSFALAAVVAILHDVILVLGVVIISGEQLNIIHVGAILTIAGYAVNDTIVIFDRIREQIRFADPDKDEKAMMNDAINFTLSRTILTSGATLSTVICLYFFGGPAMQDFSFTILVGILIGTYASICIAPACVFFFTRKHSLHEEVNRAMDAELGNTTH